MFLSLTATHILHNKRLHVCTVLSHYVLYYIFIFIVRVLKQYCSLETTIKVILALPTNNNRSIARALFITLKYICVENLKISIKILRTS